MGVGLVLILVGSVLATRAKPTAVGFEAGRSPLRPSADEPDELGGGGQHRAAAAKAAARRRSIETPATGSATIVPSSISRRTVSAETIAIPSPASTAALIASIPDSSATTRTALARHPRGAARLASAHQ